MIRVTRRSAMLALASAFLFPEQGLAKSKAPIRLIEGTTAQQRIVTAIATRALEKSRFKVELVAVPEADASSALGDGRAHAHLTQDASADSTLHDMLAGDMLVNLGGLEGNQPDEPVLKIVSPLLKKRWPYAQKMLKRMVLPRQTVAALAAKVDAGTPVDDVAAEWWQQNRRIWKPWIAASTNWMKP